MCKFAVAVILLAALCVACGGSFTPRSASQLRADATAAALRAQAEGVQLIEAANEIDAQMRRVTDEAISAKGTQRAWEATATWVARPTETSTRTPLPTAAPTPEPTETYAPTWTPASTATLEPSNTPEPVNATVTPTVIDAPARSNGPIVTPMGGAIGSLVLSLVVLLIVLRVLKVFSKDDGS